MNPQRIAIAGLIAAALSGILVLSCGDNTSDTFLDPDSGKQVASGVITGVLDWGDVSPIPETIVYAVRRYDPTCGEGPSSIHITGSHTNWSEDAWESTPGMTELFPCLWIENAGVTRDDDLTFKFVTDASWDGSFANCTSCDIDSDARRGQVSTADPGDDFGNIHLPILETADYWFVLNGSSEPGYFWILTDEEIFWDTLGVDGDRFEISGLESGAYTLIIDVPSDRDNFPTRYIRSIGVSAEEGTDLDTVEVAPTGFITGAIAFSDDPATRPDASVMVSFNESGGVVDTLDVPGSDSAFVVEGLNDAVYDLTFIADGYVASSVDSIVFVAGDEIDVGTVTLQQAGSIAGVVALSVPSENPPVISVTAWQTEDDGGGLIASVTAAEGSGAYSISGIAPGAVDLSFSAARFRDTTITEIPVVAGASTIVDTMLLVPGCVSVAETSIHILGFFNNWDESLLIDDRGMTQVESCIWKDTIDIFPAYTEFTEFKFVTDGAFDEPLDYVLCVDSLYFPHFGPVCYGPDAGTANVWLYQTGTAGSYEFLLDEDSSHYRLDLIEEFTGGMMGTMVLDSGTGPPYPEVQAEVRFTGDDLILASVEVDVATGGIDIAGLADGDYDLLLTGSRVTDSTLTVAVSGGAVTDLGTVTLEEIEFSSEFTTICVVGDFNGWNTAANCMTEESPGIWTASIIVPAGCHFMKFRTGADWGDNDYYNCSPQDPDCEVPLSGPLCHNDGAGGDPPALGKINFEAATYEFRLNEIERTYAITKLE